MIGSADLVVVSSPLQYMNAVEWRRRRPERDVDLVLLGDRAGGAASIDLLLGRVPGLWRSIRRHPRRPASPRWLPSFVRDLADARHRASLRCLAARLGRYDTLVFGDYRNLSQRALVERIAHDRLTLLDDGSITPQTARWRAGSATPDPRRFADRWFRTQTARAVLGDPPPVDPQSLGFFTIYGKLIRPTLRDSDSIEEHAFETWRNGTAHEAGDEIWLLGANHVEARVADAEGHRSLILGGVAALRRAGLAGPIVYRPHRGEDPAAAAALADAAGLQVETSCAPVELAYLDAERRPVAVAVVASSAADTLAAIDPSLAIVRFALPDGYLKRQRDHILAVVSAHDAFNPRLRVLCPGASPTDPSDAAS